NASTLYYRIKLYDQDGHIKYSNTVMVKLSNKGITVWPTLFNEQLYIGFTSQGNSTIQVQLTDAAGKIIVQSNYAVNNGYNQVTVADLGALPKGAYLLRVSNAKENVKTFKVVKE